MKLIAGSIVVLAAAVIGSAGILRSGFGSADRDLVAMSLGVAFLLGLGG
jgi:hypothetical protein